MINHGKVRSTVKPEKMVVDKYSVWINTDISEVTIEDAENNTSHVEYEYQLVQYNKDEYIKILSNQNDEIQLALVELYESQS